MLAELLLELIHFRMLVGRSGLFQYLVDLVVVLELAESIGIRIFRVAQGCITHLLVTQAQQGFTLGAAPVCFCFVLHQQLCYFSIVGEGEQGFGVSVCWGTCFQHEGGVYHIAAFHHGFHGQGGQAAAGHVDFGAFQQVTAALDKVAEHLGVLNIAQPGRIHACLEEGGGHGGRLYVIPVVAQHAGLVVGGKGVHNFGATIAHQLLQVMRPGTCLQQHIGSGGALCMLQALGQEVSVVHVPQHILQGGGVIGEHGQHHLSLVPRGQGTVVLEQRGYLGTARACGISQHGLQRGAAELVAHIGLHAQLDEVMKHLVGGGTGADGCQMQGRVAVAVERGGVGLRLLHDFQQRVEHLARFFLRLLVARDDVRLTQGGNGVEQEGFTLIILVGEVYPGLDDVLQKLNRLRRGILVHRNLCVVGTTVVQGIHIGPGIHQQAETLGQDAHATGRNRGKQTPVLARCFGGGAGFQKQAHTVGNAFLHVVAAEAVQAAHGTGQHAGAVFHHAVGIGSGLEQHLDCFGIACTCGLGEHTGAFHRCSCGEQVAHIAR